MKILTVVVSAALFFAYLYLTDGTSFQVVGLILALLALPAYFVFRSKRKEAEAQAPKGLPKDTSRREFVLAGGVVGLVSYLGYFFVPRGATAAMEPYQPTLKPVDIDLKIDAQASFSTQSPQASAPDGPFYSLDTPETRAIAGDGTSGKAMVFQGRVVDENGAPIENAIIEIWHADGNGDYDNEGYNCRGHQFTNADGCFEFQTVKPFGYGTQSLSLEGVVDYRSAHIHVKLMKGDRAQTSQIWFPDDPRNATDVVYIAVQDVCTMNEQFVDDTLYSRFDFVL